LLLPVFVLAVVCFCCPRERSEDPEEPTLTHTTPPLQHTFSEDAQTPEGHLSLLGNTTGTHYTGLTSDFDQRIFQHRSGIKSGFANKHGCTGVLLHERFADIRSAIAREKVIQGWTRTKQLA
jgi:putative endonuclease